jgi:hypothetical protein
MPRNSRRYAKAAKMVDDRGIDLFLVESSAPDPQAWEQDREDQHHSSSWVYLGQASATFGRSSVLTEIL